MANTVEVVRYRTAAACLAAQQGVSQAKLKSLPAITFWDDEGKSSRWSIQRTLRTIRDSGCWGWVNRRERTLHLWISSRAKLVDVVGLIAHELGHLEEPHRGKRAEEIKAGRYEHVGEGIVAVLNMLGTLMWFSNGDRSVLEKRERSDG